MLAGAIINHEGALRASLRAVYHLTLEEAKATMTPLQLGALVLHLPAGCALWISIGGPMAWSPETAALMQVDFRLRVLAWQGTEDAKHRINTPEPPEHPPYAHEVREKEQAVARRAERYMQRTRKDRSNV